MDTIIIDKKAKVISRGEGFVVVEMKNPNTLEILHVKLGVKVNT